MLTLAVVCALTGVVMNATISPKRLSHHVAVELGLLVLALWAAGFVLLLFAISRFNRARRIETQDLAPRDVPRLAAAQVTHARELAAQLLAGTLPVADRVWDVVLRPDESALLDITAGYSRHYGLKAPAANAAPQWREHQQCRVVLTDRRLLCQVRSQGWLSFEHSAARAMRTVPETSSVVLEYPGTSPLCLSGPSSVSVIVVVVWALHGADGLREHPALAEVRPLPLPATLVAGTTASGRRPTPTSVAVHSEDADPGEATVGENGSGDVLAFVAAHELVLDEHAAALLGVGREEAIRRLDELCGQGLLTRIRLSGQAAGAYRITDQGSELVDPALPPLRPLDLTGYRDAVGLAWLWSMARAGRFGEQRAVMTRRQMQAADSAGRTASLLGEPGARFGDQPAQDAGTDGGLAYPDLALLREVTAGWVTIDLVTSVPTPERLQSMLGRAHRDRLIASQLFLVEQDDETRELILDTAAEMGLADTVRVEVVQPDRLARA